MSQATTWGVPRSGPASPSTVFTRADESFDAALSSHKGATAPSYAVAGTRWWDDSVSGTIAIKEYDGTEWIVVGTIDTTANRFLPAVQPFVDVANATTTDLGAAASTNVRITGASGPITSFGTAPAGTFRRVRIASGGFTITHNATSLLTPDGVNITTKADDVFEAVSLGSGNWIITSYKTAFRTWRQEIRTTASGSAVEYTSLPAGIREIAIEFNGISLSGTDNLLLQIGDSGGYKTSGYSGATDVSGTATAHSTGFLVNGGASGRSLAGGFSLHAGGDGPFTWHLRGAVARPEVADLVTAAGFANLTNAIDRFRIVPTGSDTFDAGVFTFKYR